MSNWFKHVGAAFFLVVAVSMTQPVFAGTWDESSWELSAQGGAAFPQEDDEDNGYFGLGRLTYDLNDYLALGVTSGFVTYAQEAYGSDYGDFNGIPVLATAVVKLPVTWMDNKVKPYIVGGVGMMIWDYKESSLLKNNNISVDGDTAFAAQIGLGTDYRVTDSVAVFLEASYLFSTYEGKISGGGSVTAVEGDTDAIFTGAGLKITF